MLNCNLLRVGDVLRGQISVGMFLSWRRRCEAVWAIASSITVLSRRDLANWLTALLLLLLTPLACILRACGDAGWAYGDRTAHLQCLAHKELGACAHRHAGGLAHHHHGRRAHGHSTGNFEHGGGGVESGESRCCWIAGLRAVPSQELHADARSPGRRLQARHSPSR